MSELSSLKWLGTTSGEADARPSRLPDFLWPSPPIGEYPQPTPLVHPEACEIVGATYKRLHVPAGPQYRTLSGELKRWLERLG